MSSDAITLTNISKAYPLYLNQFTDRMKELFHPKRKKFHTVFEALKPVTLTIKKGETVGIIGPNGAGKSTLLKIIAGVKQATGGTLLVNGKVVALLELGGGFNPNFTGLENIYFYCSLIGLTKEQTERIVPQIIDFAEIGDYIHQQLKLYSTGMRARLSFAVSVNVEPDILILDEVLSVGDILFQRKCFAKMEEFFKSGKTIIYVSHNTESIRSLCDRCLLLHEGELILDGPTQIVTNMYHQLMFSPAEKQPGVVSRIKTLALNDSINGRSNNINDLKINALEVKETDSLPLDKENNSDFNVPGFCSKSTKCTSIKNIDISDFSIERLQGEKVTHLITGNRYRLVFHVDFKDSLELVSFVAWFYNARTQFITGFEIPDRHHLIEEISVDSRYRISGVFHCHFNPGLYGIRLVVKGDSDHAILPVSTVEDALLFQVLDVADKNNLGYVKILEKWDVKKV